MNDDGAVRLRRVIAMLSRELNRSSTGTGLSPSQASVLGLIVARGPLGLTELAELEGLHKSMLSRAIGKLIDLGMINRIPDPADQRCASVVSSSAGRQVNELIMARRAAAVSRAMELLSPEQASVLADALPALEELAGTMRRLNHADQAQDLVT